MRQEVEEQLLVVVVVVVMVQQLDGRLVSYTWTVSSQCYSNMYGRSEPCELSILAAEAAPL